MKVRTTKQMTRSQKGYAAWRHINKVLAGKNRLISEDIDTLEQGQDDAHNSEAEHLLSPAKASQQIGVSQKTLANWRCSGTSGLKFTRIGSRIFYRQSDLNAFVYGQRRDSTSERFK